MVCVSERTQRLSLNAEHLKQAGVLNLYAMSNKNKKSPLKNFLQTDENGRKFAKFYFKDLEHLETYRLATVRAIVYLLFLMESYDSDSDEYKELAEISMHIGDIIGQIDLRDELSVLDLPEDPVD